MALSRYFNGQKIYFSSDLEQLVSFNLYEEKIRNDVWKIHEGDIIMDIGTDYGPYTLTAASQGAYVYAVEPSNEGVDRLAANLELNDGFEDNVTIIQKNISGKSSLFAITIDDIISQYGIQRLDWIKLDVEGEELEALEGGINTLRRLRPRLLIENHDLKIEKDIFDLLMQFSYQAVYRHKEPLQTILGNDIIHTVWVPKRKAY